MGNVEITPNLRRLLQVKTLNEFTSEEIDELSIEDLGYLRMKYQIDHPKTTISGKKLFDPFLPESTKDIWMSVGDNFKKD
ncbi:MAG: hypothetical protein BAJALOKI1v1_180031 [Promethearchaeota archaeon]|nr:MAG: hypothetical protein BAJALOKI1v1_180031 [Candidatus Lokiarchaeota archaeon]